MKKKGLALLLAATMICGLAACGKSGGETKTDAAADTAQTEDTGDTAAASGDGITVGWIVQDMANESQSYSCRIAEEKAKELGIQILTILRSGWRRSEGY